MLFNGRTPAFQAGNAGPIPVTGSRALARNISHLCLAARNRRAVTGNMAHLRQRAEAFVTAWRDIGPSREGFPAL